LDEAIEHGETAEQLFARQPNCDDEIGKCAPARSGAVQRLGPPEQALEALSQARDRQNIPTFGMNCPTPSVTFVAS
jgi:hypothetical protein